jgi:hypothetical protein
LTGAGFDDGADGTALTDGTTPTTGAALAEDTGSLDGVALTTGGGSTLGATLGSDAISGAADGATCAVDAGSGGVGSCSRPHCTSANAAAQRAPMAASPRKSAGVASRMAETLAGLASSYGTPPARPNA